jgi:hypothetical protein
VASIQDTSTEWVAVRKLAIELLRYLKLYVKSRTGVEILPTRNPTERTGDGRAKRQEKLPAAVYSGAQTIDFTRQRPVFHRRPNFHRQLCIFPLDMQNYDCYIVVNRLAIAVKEQRNGQPERVLKEDLSEADSKDVADFD